VVRGFTIALSFLVSTLAAGPVFGQAASESNVVTATVNIAPLAKLNLSALSLTFPDTNPDTTPQVAAASGPLTITARARATPASTVTLTIRALDDLRSGTDVIPASAVSWTASGNGFVDGTLSAAADRAVGSWPTSGLHSGQQIFLFQNSWSWATGNYTVTLVYTLTAP